MKRSFLALSTLVILLGGMGQVKATQIFTYNSTGSWDGTNAVIGWGPVGNTNTPTFGQTFVAPAAALNAYDLLSFTFYLSGQGNGKSLTFQADIYDWSGNLTGTNPTFSVQGSTGAPLFTSPNMTFTDTGSSFLPITVSLGIGLRLTPGDKYVALFTTSDPGSISANGSSSARFAFGLTSGHDPNAGGGGSNSYPSNMLLSDLSNDPPTWDGGASLSSTSDLAFQAEFVPEPSTWVLGLLGLAGLGPVAWRRRRRALEATI